MQLISSFSIYGLFGTKDVHINFDSNSKVLIGENGIGKTQVLNIFYYTLNKNFLKLSEFQFDKIELKFQDEVIEILKSEINNNILEYYRHPIFKEIITAIGVAEFELLRADIYRKRRSMPRNILTNSISKSPILNKLKHIAPIEFIIDSIMEINDDKHIGKRHSKNLVPNFDVCAAKIDKITAGKSILYFPTYRRVEEDLHSLGYDEESSFGRNEENLIHFGMEDVQKKFDAVERRIDLLLKEGFAKISGEILSKLVKGFGNTSKDILDRIDENDIDIILARIGDQIAETDKSTIRRMVLEKQVAEKDSPQLYFLEILIDIYEKQKNAESSIKQFRDICNKYLVDKKIFYDESKIELYIKSDETDDSLPLSKLSSGEKQIISIFSKIYLATDNNQRFIVLFDEPELSLSMIWQKKLLPHILNSDKCDFLLVVTHSPFIFDNELDSHAIGLSEYIKPSLKTFA